MFRDEVERLFSELYATERSTAGGTARAAVDVYLADGPPPAVTVEVEAPGVDPDTIDIELQEDVLTVRGVRRRAGAGRRIYQHAEIEWGRFERRLRLGVAVDATAASASCDRGILRILLPLTAAPPRRRVEITVRAPS